MTTVRQLLELKEHDDVCYIPPEASACEAASLMADRGVAALLVREAGRVVGIVTERDFVRRLIIKGRTSKETPVRDIMSRQVTYVHAEDTIEECMALMTQRGIRHLPVLMSERVVGIISILNVVEDIISEKEFVIHQLESYIVG